MTSSATINRILKDEKNFLGCFSHSSLSTLNISYSQLPKYLIININTCKKTNGHWVVLYMSNEKECFYFDSFGEKVTNNNLKNFISIRYSSVIYNDLILQSVSSKTCGLFSIIFVQSVKTKEDYAKFLKKFSVYKLKLNDTIAYNMLNMLNTKKK